MFKNLFSIEAFATGGGGGNGRNRAGSGVGRIVRGSQYQRRGNESMGSYYRRTGFSMLSRSPRANARRGARTPGTVQR